MSKLHFLFFILLVFSSCSRKVVYFGGDIITMEENLPQYVEAVVQDKGKIVFTGSKEEAENIYRSAVKVDLKGKTMLPGFIDGHGHFLNVGINALTANILSSPDGPGDNFAAVIAALEKYKNSDDGKYMIKKTGWIIGNGYDDSQLREHDHPTKSDLDKVSKALPVIIIHQSGHIGVLNSKALEIVGYTADTKDPEGGTIRRSKDGSPNGVLEEAAFFKILFQIMAKVDAGLALKAIKSGQVEYAKNGYLTVQDGRTTIEQLKALETAARFNRFYLDIVAYPDITLGTGYITQHGFSPSKTYRKKFRIGGVKLTLDGSPQGKTAWLTQCYHVNPEGREDCYKGYPVMPDEKATEYVKTAFKNKWQIMCHVNGDAAIDQYLKAVALAENEFGYEDHRTVLIHGQTLRKDQIPLLVQLKIYPSLFPMHTYYWGDWHKSSVLGEPRADYISPCRDVVDAGLTITSHHDAPVTFPNAMRVLDATVNRITKSGVVLGPGQRLTAYEGLKTLTDWASKQYFEEDKKGTISKGKLADFIILDKNPLTIDPPDIHTIQILQSIKEGKMVYEKK